MTISTSYRRIQNGYHYFQRRQGHDNERFSGDFVAGPILLTLAWIVLGLMRPATKNEWGVSGGITGMITQPFSGLGIGSNGFLFNAAFLLNGLLILAGVFGVFQTIEASGRSAARRACAVLLALSGLGSVM